jgi:hypothetical protein
MHDAGLCPILHYPQRVVQKRPALLISRSFVRFFREQLGCKIPAKPANFENGHFLSIYADAIHSKIFENGRLFILGRFY